MLAPMREVVGRMSAYPKESGSVSASWSGKVADAIAVVMDYCEAHSRSTKKL